MHWADVIASELLEQGTKHRIATGITPSGHIHVGNMREILTGDIIHRALKDKGGDSTLYYLGDTFDPLRKVYPFLDKSYQQYVGRPLSEIPCPCGNHESYAVHFLEPFMESLDRLGVDYTPLLIHELYKQGKYAESVRKVIENRDTIKEILERVSGRTLPKGWFPYTPKCSECGTFGGKVIEYTYPFVTYSCSCSSDGTTSKSSTSNLSSSDPSLSNPQKSNSSSLNSSLSNPSISNSFASEVFEGRADIRSDDGKLPWRVDWPARWWFLGITCEPFGKDHGAAGGSYDTGTEIVRKVFERSAPHPLMYEWIQLKGKGAMSSSTGVVVTGVEMLKMTPPEVLRFLISKQNPSKHIDFDPGLGVLNLVDEYDRAERIYYGIDPDPEAGDIPRSYELSDPHVDYQQHLPDDVSRSAKKMALQVPYRHLVTLVQLTDDFEELKDRIKRTEGIEDFSSDAEERLLERVDCCRHWVDNFAPAGVKFALQQVMPSFSPNPQEREFLNRLHHVLGASKWEAEDIHKNIHESSTDLGAKKAFRVLYQIFLGNNRGPRLGFFLSSLDRDFVVGRLDEASLAKDGQ